MNRHALILGLLISVSLHTWYLWPAVKQVLKETPTKQEVVALAVREIPQEPEPKPVPAPKVAKPKPPVQETQTPPKPPTPVAAPEPPQQVAQEPPPPPAVQPQPEPAQEMEQEPQPVEPPPPPPPPAQMMKPAAQPVEQTPPQQAPEPIPQPAEEMEPEPQAEPQPVEQAPPPPPPPQAAPTRLASKYKRELEQLELQKSALAQMAPQPIAPQQVAPQPIAPQQIAPQPMAEIVKPAKSDLPPGGMFRSNLKNVDYSLQPVARIAWGTPQEAVSAIDMGRMALVLVDGTGRVTGSVVGNSGRWERGGPPSSMGTYSNQVRVVDHVSAFAGFASMAQRGEHLAVLIPVGLERRIQRAMDSSSRSNGLARHEVAACFGRLITDQTGLDFQIERVERRVTQ